MEKRKPLGVLKTFSCGLLLGISNAIPGISGGTMAVVLNIFDKLLDSLSISKWKKNLDFLIPLFLGAGAGVIALSKAIVPLINRYPIAVGFSFMGLILGSLPIISRHAFNDGERPKPLNIALGIFCLGIMIAMSNMERAELANGASYRLDYMDPKMFVILVITSAISAIAMIIPGISGSLVMLMLGTYTIILGGISRMDFTILLPTTIGVLLGLFIGISGIKKAMTYFPQAMYFSILGLVFGSLLPVYPGWEANAEGFIGIGCCIFFTIASYLSSKPRN